MASIAEHLATLNLSQYAGRFAAEGVASVAQLQALSSEDLETRLSSLGMLKGHAMKFRISLDAIKQGRPPAPQPPAVQKPQPAKPPAAKLPDNPLMAETQRINAKLAEIDALRQAISTSKDAIMRLDVEAYRKVLEQIETLQTSLRTQEAPPQTMEVQEGQE